MKKILWVGVLLICAIGCMACGNGSSTKDTKSKDSLTTITVGDKKADLTKGIEEAKAQFGDDCGEDLNSKIRVMYVDQLNCNTFGSDSEDVIWGKDLKVGSDYTKYFPEDSIVAANGTTNILLLDNEVVQKADYKAFYEEHKDDLMYEDDGNGYVSKYQYMSDMFRQYMKPGDKLSDFYENMKASLSTDMYDDLDTYFGYVVFYAYNRTENKNVIRVNIGLEDKQVQSIFMDIPVEK